MNLRWHKLPESKKIKQQFGADLLIVAHHYQKDEVMQFADARGDSLKLAQIAAANQQAKTIVSLRGAFYGRNGGYSHQ
jgi:quinolinate synthase